MMMYMSSDGVESGSLFMWVKHLISRLLKYKVGLYLCLATFPGVRRTAFSTTPVPSVSRTSVPFEACTPAPNPGPCLALNTRTSDVLAVATPEQSIRAPTHLGTRVHENGSHAMEARRNFLRNMINYSSVVKKFCYVVWESGLPGYLRVHYKYQSYD